jgi:7-carboxy-7-deazaguanine synthase
MEKKQTLNLKGQKNPMTIDNYKYYVSEIFESIQGEGNFAGTFSLFIRFHFCNLSCSWCDTKYTWNEKSGSYKIYSPEELKTIIKSSKAQHVVFTGGEPLLYRIDKILVYDKHFHVETNATILPDERVDITFNESTRITRDAMELNMLSDINFIVSPKLSNSQQIINSDNISFWAKEKLGIFKFVVKSVEDLEEVVTLIGKFNIPNEKVYIGLEGVTVESQLRPDLVEEIVKRGYNFSPRLHILLWGNIRGK